MRPAPSTRTSLLVGLALTVALASTLTIAGLKAGILPGVSPLVVLFAWGAFSKRLSAGSGSRFLNLTQVAGSAGMAVAVGLVFTAPLLPILESGRAGPGLTELNRLSLELAATAPDSPERESRAAAVAAAREAILEAAPGVDLATLIAMSLIGAAIGFGFVGLSTRRFLSDPSLPAPEAKACRTMIEAAVSGPERRPALASSLGLGVLLGFAARIVTWLGVTRDKLVLLPWKENAFQKFAFTNADQSRSADVSLQFAPLYIGIGGLLTLGTGLLVFTGSLTHSAGAALLASVDAGTDLAEYFPANSMRWVGGSAMTVAVIWSLLRFAWQGAPAAPAGVNGEPESDPGLLHLPRATRALLVLSVALGLAGLVAFLLLRDGPTPFALAAAAALAAICAVMVALGALLSLQVGSSASPVSGTIFVSTLLLCLVALSLGRRSMSDIALLTPLLVAVCVAVSTANDSSQDYKTLQLCGISPRTGFFAQAAGLAVGSIVVPVTMVVAHRAFVLGSADLAAPQGALFATLTEALLLQGDVPRAPIGVGVLLGLLAVGLEIAGERRGAVWPSMALAVGIYLPPYLGFGMILGTLARAFGERKRQKQPEVILAAAGLITGAALLELVFGFALLALPWLDPVVLLALEQPPSTAWRIRWTAIGLSLFTLFLFASARRAPKV